MNAETKIQPALIVVVETRIIGEEEPESIREINQYSKSDRLWLAKHAWWAMHNKREVSTFPKLA